MEFAVVECAGAADGVQMACQTFGMGLAVNDFYEVLINFCVHNVEDFYEVLINFWVRRRRKFKFLIRGS